MIISAIIYVFSILLRVVAFIAPEWRLPDFILIGFDYFITNIVLWNNFFPIWAVTKCIIIIIAFQLALTLARITMGTLSIIRGGGKIDI